MIGFSLQLKVAMKNENLQMLEFFLVVCSIKGNHSLKE